MEIAAIAIGPDCPAANSSLSLYYFFDNLLLDDLNSFEFRIGAVSHPCDPDFTLRVPPNSTVSYQWYKEGVALLGETAAELTRLYGEGDYQVRLNDGGDCKVSLTYTHRVPDFTTLDRKTICKDGEYRFGTQLLTASGNYRETFRSKDNCDSTVSLTLTVLGTLADTVDASVLAGESYRYEGRDYWREGDHAVALRSAIGCDSLVMLQLKHLRLFIPNAFSPNLDGINDQFRIASEAGTVEEVTIHVYDRWGSKVSEGPEWDGLRAGQPVNAGLFIYVAQVRLSDGVEHRFSGSVMVTK